MGQGLSCDRVLELFEQSLKSGDLHAWASGKDFNTADLNSFFMAQYGARISDITMRRAVRKMTEDKKLVSLGRNGLSLGQQVILKQVSVIASQVEDPYFGRVLKGILEQAFEEQVSVRIVDCAGKAHKEVAAFKHCLPSSAGIIWVPNRDDSMALEIYNLMKTSNDVNVVAVERKVQRPEFAEMQLVACENEVGGHLIGWHLVEQLMKRNPHLNEYRLLTIGRDRTLGQTQRVAGFRAAIEKASKLFPGRKFMYASEDEFWIRPEDNTFKVTSEALTTELNRRHLNQMLIQLETLKDDGQPIAIFCLADAIALVLSKWLKQFWQEVHKGKKVMDGNFPRNLLVAGFDDQFAADPMGLTTIQQDFEAIGRAAFDEAMRPSREVRRIIPSLVIRRSTDLETKF